MLAVCAVFAASSPALAQPAKPATAVVETGFGHELSAGTSALIARWTPYVKEAARRFGIAEDWITAVMRMESGGHTKSADGAPIISKAGAMGLMQLMPETWRDMQREYRLGSNPYDPHDNVIAGAAYLRWLYERYGFPKMFAAYNAGPATEDEHSAGLKELPDETRNYVRGIARILGSNAPESQSAATNLPAYSAQAAPGAKSVPVSTMVALTRPDGVQVAIDAASVTSIRVPIPDEYAPGIQTVLSMGLRRQGVLEGPEKVMAMLKSHGARI